MGWTMDERERTRRGGMSMRWIKRLWARLFKRRKGYIEAVMDERPIALYLMGKEDFIPRDE